MPISADSRKRIDMIVTLDKVKYPIEIKYRRKELKDENGDRVLIGDNYDRIEFTQDIQRLENYIIINEYACFGYALWFTNVSSIWEKQKKESDQLLSVYDGKQFFPCDMEIKRYPNAPHIILKGSYTIKWEELFNIENPKDRLFNYALIPIRKSQLVMK